MADRPSLPFRMLRGGLKAASRASAAVVERVLRHDTELGPAPSAQPRGPVRRSGPARVRFGAVSVELPPGGTILDAARQADVDLRHYCGGNCSCGTCRVEIRGGAAHLSRASGMEELVLGPQAVARGDRLACQAQVLGDVEVHVPDDFI